MRTFPEIKQFRDVVAIIKSRAAFTGLDAAGKPTYDETRPLPTLHYTGTVKLHGTNCAIVFENGTVVFQSRERELSLEEDNYGFYSRMQNHLALLNDFAARIASQVALRCLPLRCAQFQCFGQS